MEKEKDPDISPKNSSKFDAITTEIIIDSEEEQFCDVSFLLSIFDNIVGPKIMHIWKYDVHCNYSLRGNSHLSDYLLKYIAIHTLNGELYQDKLMGQIKYRIYFIKEVNCAIFSVFFDAQTADINDFGSSCNIMKKIDLKCLNDNLNNKNCKKIQNFQTQNNCLSLIFPLNKKDSFFNKTLLNTNVFLNFFENIILEFKVYAHIRPKIGKVSSAIEYLTTSIKHFGEMIQNLNRNGIFKTITSFNVDKENENMIPVSIDETFFNDAYLTSSTNSLITNEFVLKSVTSHLITNYNTIIVGKTSALVNKMINTLAIFMPKEKIRLSCYAIQDTGLLCPYFLLQGLVTEYPEKLTSILEADFLFKRNHPTTIIDISNKTVCRTSIGKEFIHIKEQFIREKIKILYNNMSLSQLNVLYPANKYLNWISYSTNENQPKLIEKLLQELELFDIEFGIKQSFIEKKLLDLNLMALSLIEYINSKLLETSHKTNKSIKISSKKLFRIIDISSDEDLNVVLAFANNLKPDLFRNLNFSN